MPHDDTIVAVSSPPGRSPRGLIRISGPSAKSIVAALSDTVLTDRKLAPCRLLERRLPALICFFAGPRSYTSQDLVEFQVPGNPALLDRLIHQVIAHGARLAEPGEFTFRAYLAGKLDLTQAEGIAATIAATSDSQLAAASLLRDGALGRIAGELVESIGTNLALVEAGIDFTDQDDVVPITPARLDANLAVIEARLDDLLQHSRSWGALEALPRVVLVGEPSAGKSTLFNALLGRERAVISEAPGTTRDLLAEPMKLRNAAGDIVELMLIDIAGLDDPRSLIDQQMQAAAQSAIQSADLLLLVADADHAFPSPDALPAQTPVLRVRTKADLLPPSSPAGGADKDPDVTTVLSVSAKTGLHLEELRHAIATTLDQRGVSIAADMLALQPRHESALHSAFGDVAAARQLLASQHESPSIDHVELVAGALRTALDQLAGLGGTLTPDDLIGRVFATFCIGK